MSDILQVSGYASNLLKLLRLIGPSVLIAGIVFLAIAKAFLPVGLVPLPVALVPLLVGSCITGIAVYLTLKCRRQRSWLEVGQDDFVFTNRQGTFEIADADVNSMSVSITRRYNNGKFQGFRRQLTLWTDQLADPIECINDVGDNDPIASLIERLTTGLHARFEEELEAGRPVRGANWTLTKKHFEVSVESKVHLLELRDIAAFDVIKEQLNVWRRGEDRPQVRLPLNQRNNSLLPLLLSPRIIEQPDVSAGTSRSAKSSVSAPPAQVSGDKLGHATFATLAPTGSDKPSETDLGRVIFERKITQRKALAALASILILIFSLCAFSEVPLVGALLLVMGLSIAVAGYYSKEHYYVFRESGVQHQVGKKTKQLTYAEITSLSFCATKQYHNGRYQATFYILAIKSASQPLNVINVKLYSVNDDVELERMRDFISNLIAHNMLQKLAAGEEVSWTNNLTFTATGIQVNQGGRLSSGVIVIPYGDYRGPEFHDGVFYLRAANGSVVFQEDLSAENLFPGLTLLQIILNSGSSD